MDVPFVVRRVDRPQNTPSHAAVVNTHCVVSPEHRTSLEPIFLTDTVHAFEAGTDIDIDIDKVWVFWPTVAITAMIVVATWARVLVGRMPRHQRPIGDERSLVDSAPS